MRRYFNYTNPVLVTSVLFFLSGLALGLFERKSVWVIAVIAVFSAYRGRFFANKVLAKSLPYLLFFALHLVGILYSAHTGEAWTDIESKLVLLILPICVFCWDRSRLVLHAAIWGLGIGSLLRLTTGFFYGVISDWGSADTFLVTYTDLSMGIHPTYIGLYLIFFQMFLVGKFKTSEASIGLWIWLAISGGFVILLSSKMALFAEILVLITAIYYHWKYQRKTRSLWLSMGLCWIFLLVISSQNTLINQRFNNFFNANSGVVLAQEQPMPESQGAPVQTESTGGLRVQIWKAAWVIIQNNPFIGVGTGDVNAELQREFSNQNFQIGVDRNYNAHNTYLQIALAFGALGILVLGYLLLNVFSSFRSKRPTWKYVFFGLLLLFLTFESMFERQGGLLFFCLFLPLLSSSEIDA